MSADDMIAHWQKGASDSYEAAVALFDLKKFSLALFHCHLAVEKKLKALYMTEHLSDPPPTHNLALLAEELNKSWSEADTKLLNNLTDYAIAARYDDPHWAETQATQENTKKWLNDTEQFLNTLS